ncbi:HAMP domain-containing histidine kinase [Isoptericola sp. NEAU-Y5]|uniref:histidine kinase n=1 Tax=Isoptericola luteus TaxID=2879484 RepID=A0ABS7ZCQ3_9MICO|nr:HAMP domain-containing sensor histidine kinase [Isoptericola sp. NEAU-Y5]MCA5892693.1 HAMP domain-containing histidine kinase [Isoptericola sp. NEAU-Y5]
MVRAGGPRRGLTVRTRILAALLALTALALAFSGATAFLLTYGQIDERIDADLSESADELRTLAASGVNPVTGDPFSSADEVVVAMIQLDVPADHEGVLGLRSGRSPLVTQQAVELHLEDDAAFVEAVTPLLTSDHVMLRSIQTPTTHYRALIAPVAALPQGGGVPADEPAALVLAYDRVAEHAETQRVFRVYALVALGALGFAGVVGWLLAGRLLRPIRTLATTAQRISDTDLSARIPETGNDDLTHLSGTVNAMLGRLEGSFEAQRRLLDDVGHELRTPLTVVRGHLELMDPHDPADAAETRGIALDELDRMHRIVDDLVTLATADQPDFVRLAPVDLGRLTDDMFDKVRPLGHRTWLVDARTDARTMADAQRLTQAWMQLAANAVKFSGDASTIAIGSRTTPDGARVRLWVRDEGVGIPEDEIGSIFERFSRGRQTGERRDGAGLGLTIVSAIAEAHGGEVTVDSVVGQGSTFSVVVPVLPVPDADPSPTGTVERTAP